MDDFETLLVFWLETGIALQNAGRACCTSQRVPEFVSQTRRELADSK